MKFDCIIINPPYRKNLHLKILSEAIKHLKDDGTCVNLSPDNWLMKHNVNNPIGEYRKMFNGILTNIDVICHDYMNMFFSVSTAKLVINFKIKDDNSLKNHLTLYFFCGQHELKSHRGGLKME